MKRLVPLCAAAVAATLMLGGCCFNHGQYALDDAICGDAPRHTSGVTTGYYRHEGMMGGMHGWYDTNGMFHEGRYQPEPASNIGYYDAAGVWRSDFEVNAGRMDGYYDTGGIWHREGRPAQ